MRLGSTHGSLAKPHHRLPTKTLPNGPRHLLVVLRTCVLSATPTMVAILVTQSRHSFQAATAWRSHDLPLACWKHALLNSTALEMPFCPTLGMPSRLFPLVSRMSTGAPTVPTIPTALSSRASVSATMEDRVEVSHARNSCKTWCGNINKMSLTQRGCCFFFVDTKALQPCLNRADLFLKKFEEKS